MCPISSFSCYYHITYSQGRLHLCPRASHVIEKDCHMVFSCINFYSLPGIAHDFMGHLPRLIKKTRNLENLFPSLSLCEPMVYKDEPFYLSFMRNRVFRSSPSTNNPSYIKWLDRVQQRKERVWKDQGIFDLIQLLRVGPKYNPHMLVVVIFFLESTTNTFPYHVEWSLPHYLIW